MSFENHFPRYHKRTDNDNWDCLCSCGLWQMRNHPKEDIRHAHDEHVQKELGPEVKNDRHLA